MSLKDVKGLSNVDLLSELCKSTTLTDQDLVDLTLTSESLPFFPFFTCLHFSQFPLSRPSLDTDVKLEPLLLLVLDEQVEPLDDLDPTPETECKSKLDKELAAVETCPLFFLDFEELFTDTELAEVLQDDELPLDKIFAHNEPLELFVLETVQAVFSFPLILLPLGEVVRELTLSPLCDRFLQSVLVSECDWSEVFDLEPPELDLLLLEVSEFGSDGFELEF